MAELILTFGLLVVLGFFFMSLVLIIIPNWLIFKKAGRKGWESIIPIYNAYVMTVIAGLPWWVFLGLFIPVLNIVTVLYIAYNLSKKFGHGMAYALGITFLPFIFLPVLGYGDAVYVGQAEQTPVSEDATQGTAQTVAETVPENKKDETATETVKEEVKVEEVKTETETENQISTNVSEVAEIKTEVKTENSESVAIPPVEVSENK